MRLFVRSGIHPTWIGSNVGDHWTAGFVNERTYLNSNMDNFNPPLKLFETINLPGINNAQTILAFDNQLLIGEATTSQNYHLYDRGTGTVRWTNSLEGGQTDFNYVPAYGADIAILGGQGTTSVAAVRVSTGTQLWKDEGPGDTEGRHPIVLNSQYSYYSGNNFVRAANATTGEVFWTFSVTTAKAPVTVRDQEVYVLEKTGILHGLRDTSLTPL